MSILRRRRTGGGIVHRSVGRRREQFGRIARRLESVTASALTIAELAEAAAHLAQQAQV